MQLRIIVRCLGMEIVEVYITGTHVGKKFFCRRREL
jgi:hypothetical protein